MRILVIDTATEALSVALFEDGRQLAHHHEMAGRGHAEKLVPAIAALPDRGRADRIFVDVGPGSFTGVRIGVAAARALALAWKVPVHGYGALSLIAASVPASDTDQPMTVAVTGGHGELFWQQFMATTRAPLGDVASTPIADLTQRLDGAVIHGSGAAALVAARGWGDAITLHPDAGDFPLLAPSLANLPPSPVYVRGADAKPMKPAGTPG